jgi:trehalose-phosphatase
VVKRAKEATLILLFLDYDGTLTPIAARPEMAVLSSPVREILKQISQHSLFKLAIITGRSLSDIRVLVGLENITYVGNHGLEIEWPPCPVISGERSLKTTTFIRPIAKELQPELKKLEQ